MQMHTQRIYSLAIVQMQCSIIGRRFACSQTLGKVIELDNVLLEQLLQRPGREQVELAGCAEDEESTHILAALEGQPVRLCQPR